MHDHCLKVAAQGRGWFLQMDLNNNLMRFDKHLTSLSTRSSDIWGAAQRWIVLGRKRNQNWEGVSQSCQNSWDGIWRGLDWEKCFSRLSDSKWWQKQGLFQSESNSKHHCQQPCIWRYLHQKYNSRWISPLKGRVLLNFLFFHKALWALKVVGK